MGLPSGSGPPIRAETSTALTSFAKSFDRLASITAFLCLVVAHLEWPLIDNYLSITTKQNTYELDYPRSIPDEMKWLRDYPVLPSQFAALVLDNPS